MLICVCVVIAQRLAHHHRGARQASQRCRSSTTQRQLLYVSRTSAGDAFCVVYCIAFDCQCRIRSACSSIMWILCAVAANFFVTFAVRVSLLSLFLSLSHIDSLFRLSCCCSTISKDNALAISFTYKSKLCGTRRALYDASVRDACAIVLCCVHPLSGVLGMLSPQLPTISWANAEIHRKAECVFCVSLSCDCFSPDCATTVQVYNLNKRAPFEAGTTWASVARGRGRRLRRDWHSSLCQAHLAVVCLSVIVLFTVCVECDLLLLLL